MRSGCRGGYSRAVASTQHADIVCWLSNTDPVRSESGRAFEHAMGPYDAQSLLVYGLALTTPGQTTPDLRIEDGPRFEAVKDQLPALIEGAEIAWLAIKGEDMPICLVVGWSDNDIWLVAQKREPPVAAPPDSPEPAAS